MTPEMNELLAEMAETLTERDVPPFNRDNKNPKFKALVAKLKKNPKVKDPEALAYTIGLRKLKNGKGGGGEGGDSGSSGGDMKTRGWERIKKGFEKLRVAFGGKPSEKKPEPNAAPATPPKKGKK